MFAIEGGLKGNKIVGYVGIYVHPRFQIRLQVALHLLFFLFFHLRDHNKKNSFGKFKDPRDVLETFTEGVRTTVGNAILDGDLRTISVDDELIERTLGGTYAYQNSIKGYVEYLILLA